MEKYFIAIVIILLILIIVSIYLLIPTDEPIKKPTDNTTNDTPEIDTKLLELQSVLAGLFEEKDALDYELAIYDENFEPYDKLIIDIKAKQEDKLNLESKVLPDLNKSISSYKSQVDSLQSEIDNNNKSLSNKSEEIRLMKIDISELNKKIVDLQIQIDTKSAERQKELDPIVESVRLLGIDIGVLEDEINVKMETNYNLNGLINAELERIRLVLIEEEAKLNLHITNSMFGSMDAVYYDDIKDKSTYKSVRNTISPYYEYDSDQFYSLLGSLEIPTNITLIGIELGLIFSVNGEYSYDANNNNETDFGIVTLKDSKNENVETYKISNKYALIKDYISSDKYGDKCTIVVQWMSKYSTKYIGGLPDISVIAYYE